MVIVCSGNLLHCVSRLLADIVAKVVGSHSVRNNRIQQARRLNQSCFAGGLFESKLLHGALKIVLQHYLHVPNLAKASADFGYWSIRWGNRPAFLWIAEDLGCCASG